MAANKNTAFVSFIVVGWNNLDLLNGCFDSILQQTYKKRSIVYVDNGSADGSIDHVRRNYPSVVIVDAGHNQGFAIGNNLGIAKAFEDPDCTHVSLLNSDATVAPNWLEALLTFAQQHPHSASLQTPTYDYYDHAVVDSTSITINRRGQAVQLGYRLPKSELQTEKVFGVNAAAALYSRDFLSSQPFDADYFDSTLWMYLEDIDIAARATLMGWDSWSVNTSAAYHMGSASSGKNPGFSVYYIYRNNLPMLVKNLPARLVLRILPRLIVADVKILIGLARGRSYIAIKAILCGRLKGIFMTRHFIGKHRQLKKQTVLSTSDIWKLLTP
jgi:GT2 family glycosyltransferase